MSTDNNQIKSKEISEEKIIDFTNPIIEINNLSVKYGPNGKICRKSLKKWEKFKLLNFLHNEPYFFLINSNST